ncbi:hypothetical protein LXL04_019320 [Taraxacum kok-saghyz]
MRLSMRAVDLWEQKEIIGREKRNHPQKSSVGRRNSEPLIICGNKRKSAEKRSSGGHRWSLDGCEQSPDVASVYNKNAVRYGLALGRKCPSLNFLLPPGQKHTESGRTEFDVGLRLRPDRVRHQTLLPNAQTKDRVRHLRQNLSLRNITTDRVRGKTSDPGPSLTSQERYQTLGLRTESVV